jgi:hypothetical protein
MYATAIDLSEMKRVQLVELCNASLADAVDLQLHCKHAHWNVKGPNFIALHQLFDQVNWSQALALTILQVPVEDIPAPDLLIKEFLSAGRIDF